MTMTTQTGELARLDEQIEELTAESRKIGQAIEDRRREFDQQRHANATHAAPKSGPERIAFFDRFDVLRAELGDLDGQARQLEAKRQKLIDERAELEHVAALLRQDLRLSEHRIAQVLEPAARAKPLPGILAALEREKAALARHKERLTTIEGA